MGNGAARPLAPGGAPAQTVPGRLGHDSGSSALAADADNLRAVVKALARRRLKSRAAAAGAAIPPG